MDGIAALASTPGAELLDRLATVEKENCTLRDSKSFLVTLSLACILIILIFWYQLLKN